MFKLDQLAADDTATLELVNPNTEAPLGIFVTCHTPDSAKYEQLTKKFSNPSQKQSILIGKKGENNKIEIDPEQAVAREKILIASVVEITGIEDIDHSPAGYAKVLKNPQYNWMLEQIAEYFSERKNYMKIAPND